MNLKPLQETESEHQFIFENSLIDIRTLPDADDIVFDSIERRYANVLYLSSSVFFLIILILLFAILIRQIGLFHWISLGSLLLWVVLLLISFWFSSVSVQKKSYAIRDKDISYKSGVFFRSWITIPFNRVQHCEISRSIYDNLFGLVELKIFTAGGSSSDISIPGLNPPVAHTLKDLIMNKVENQDEEE